MKITENGRAICGIVLPENPTLREIFAAQELMDYIKKISGAEVGISGIFENIIIIGGPDRNEAAKTLLSRDDFEKMVPGPEGFIIKVENNKMLIAGSSKHPGEQERGTLAGVYEFLERFLGCSLSVY